MSGGARMTCIVALEARGRVYMASDTFGSNGHTGATYEAPKTFRNGSALIGVCGSYRMMQLLQYALVVPEVSLSWDVDRWVALDLMPAIRTAFMAHGWDRVAEGRARGGSFLFAIAGRCYEIQSDYSFLRSSAGEYAIGSGTYHALGSLHSTRDWAKPKRRLSAALAASAEHVVSVAGPFHFVQQEGSE